MKKYSIIYADPPWAYRTYSKKGQGRSAESHYPTMCIEDIKALPVGELAARTAPCSFGSRSRASVKHSKCWRHGAFPIRPWLLYG